MSDAQDLAPGVLLARSTAPGPKRWVMYLGSVLYTPVWGESSNMSLIMSETGQIIPMSRYIPKLWEVVT